MGAKPVLFHLTEQGLSLYADERIIANRLLVTVPQSLWDGDVSSHLSSAGHGDSDLVAGNNTVAGRAKNRRVGIIVS